jgi:RNA polymerase sigma-70 factor (ECF subfamily)
VLDGESRRALLAAIDALPAKLRDAVACRHLLDLSEAETAAALGVPPGTVKSRVSRALDRLRVALEEEVDGA